MTAQAIIDDFDYNMFLENPSVLDNFMFFYTRKQITVKKLVYVILGATSSTVFISFGPDRSTTPTDIIDAGTVVSNTTTGQIITTFDNAVIPENNFVVVRVTANVLNPDQLDVHLVHT